MAGFPQNENGIKDHEQNILTKGKERERKRDNYSSARETEEDLSMGPKRERSSYSVSQSVSHVLIYFQIQYFVDGEGRGRRDGRARTRR